MLKKLLICCSLLIVKDCVAQERDVTITKRPLDNFDPVKPPFLFTEATRKNQSRLLRYSMLTGYREGVEKVQGLANFTSYHDKSNGTTKIYMFNLSIQDMLTLGFYNSSRIILEVKDPKIYRYDPSQGDELAWKRNNAHCLEFMLPTSTIKNADLFKRELSRVFNVEFGLKKRMTDVLVLKRTSTTDKIKSLKQGDASYNLQGHLNNIVIDRLISILYEANLPTLINETDYKNTVDIDLEITKNMSIEVLRKQLAKYDLDITSERREVDMFVITEINK